MSHNDLSIAILIPVYNVADYLADCLDAIIKQIDSRATIIVMDDASTDNSFEILKSYESYPQVQIVAAPCNRGLSATRNALLALTNAEYIWFIDSDDVMNDKAYDLVMKALFSDPVDVLIGDYQSWRGDTKKVKKAFIGHNGETFENSNNSFLKNIVKNNSNFVWNKVYRRETIENIPFKNVKFEDVYFMTQLSFHCRNYKYCHYPLINYRKRESSIVNTINENYVNDYLNAFIHRVNEWRSRQHDDADDFIYYLLYKTFNRYSGLMKELFRENNTALSDYTYQYYHRIFIVYYQEAKNNLGWIQDLKMQIKFKSVMSKFNSKEQKE